MLKQVQAKPTETWCLFLSPVKLIKLGQWTSWQTHSQMAEALESLMLLMTITEKA
jgi:hypothetical protein